MAVWEKSKKFSKENMIKLLEEIKKDICRDSGGILEAVNL